MNLSGSCNKLGYDFFHILMRTVGVVSPSDDNRQLVALLVRFYDIFSGQLRTCIGVGRLKWLVYVGHLVSGAVDFIGGHMNKFLYAMQPAAFQQIVRA
ncbi:hypothetical protein BpHYR1_022266 [Brachionus plicatilis]|uniref:Uncharacterized protein n=1 Tax=Brachionus plicatilis TaxID=10195 RepID=A0A3M7RF93_BRAPC|nr:hypothetical protein BpHYR1_022266 [Brachionus plicatilis]